MPTFGIAPPGKCCNCYKHDVQTACTGAATHASEMKLIAAHFQCKLEGIYFWPEIVLDLRISDS